MFGVVRAPVKPIFYENYIEVNFSKKRLPITVPTGWAKVCNVLALSADLIYLIDKLSNDKSWMAKKNTPDIRMNAKIDADVMSSVKNELINKKIEHNIWLKTIHVFLFPYFIFVYFYIKGA